MSTLRPSASGHRLDRDRHRPQWAGLRRRVVHVLARSCRSSDPACHRRRCAVAVRHRARPAGGDLADLAVSPPEGEHVSGDHSTPGSGSVSWSLTNIVQSPATTSASSIGISVSKTRRCSPVATYANSKWASQIPQPGPRPSPLSR